MIVRTSKRIYAFHYTMHSSCGTLSLREPTSSNKPMLENWISRCLVGRTCGTTPVYHTILLATIDADTHVLAPIRLIVTSASRVYVIEALIYHILVFNFAI